MSCHRQAHIAQVANLHWLLAVTMTEPWLNSLARFSQVYSLSVDASHHSSLSLSTFLSQPSRLVIIRLVNEHFRTFSEFSRSQSLASEERKIARSLSLKWPEAAVSCFSVVSGRPEQLCYIEWLCNLIDSHSCLTFMSHLDHTPQSGLIISHFM